MRSLGALVSALVAGAAGMFGGGDDLPPPPPVHVEPGTAAVSAYFGRLGGSYRLRRNQSLCGYTDSNGIAVPSRKQHHDALEKTRRDVAYDKRRPHRARPMLTSTGLPAFRMA